MSLAIRVENLSKRYRLGLTHAGSIRELVNRAVGRLKGKKEERLPHELAHAHAAGRQIKPDGTFWALEDVSFEVNEGDVLGIIGRNGAGKSTLLKILSRITAPTEGRVELFGRVASLLEVGTGFHPELTGRENVFLNGAILGMRRAEVKRKFDEIVAFAEIDRFIDTPVKRYSSGMYVRLAFAVAAHLEPEILVVDEVLAVGDAAFQKKCLGKMGDVARGGRTVLFVSHNMAAILNLCGRAILLDKGRLVLRDHAPLVVSAYCSSAAPAARVDLGSRPDRRGSGMIRFQSVAFLNGAGKTADTYPSGEPMRIVLEYENTSDRPARDVLVAIGISDEFGDRISQFNSDASTAQFPPVPPGRGVMEVTIDRLPLTRGSYGVNLWCSVGGEIADWFIGDVAGFSVCEGDYFGTGRLPPPGQGRFVIDHTFALRT